jgi:hypothetical protein
MAPERKLYQKLKKNITTISWIRLENLSLSGTPDLLGVEALGPGTVKLYEGSRILELDACGLELNACSLGLEACGLWFESLGK